MMFLKSFISSRRVKSILISCLSPQRTNPSRRAPGKQFSFLNYRFYQRKIIFELLNIQDRNSLFKLSQNADDSSGDRLNFVNDVATKLDDNDNSSMTFETFSFTNRTIQVSKFSQRVKPKVDVQNHLDRQVQLLGAIACTVNIAEC